MKKYFTHSTSEGCISNYNEESLYSEYLNQLGFSKTSNKDEADVIIVNTCSHLPPTKEATTQILSKYEPYKNKLIVTGCYPLMYRKEFQNLNVHHFKPGDLEGLSRYLNLDFQPQYIDDHTMGIKDISLFDPYQKIIFKLRPLFKNKLSWFFRRSQYFYNFIETVTINPNFFVIRTGIGCLGNCTFCGIKRSKGRIKSKSLGAILAEIEVAKEKKSEMICLSGEDIGCWGQDINISSVELLKNVLENTGDSKIVIEYFDPEWLIKYKEELIPLFQDKKIICVTMALQSGSKKIIELMGRRYDPTEVIKVIREIKRKNPNIIIKSNTIAGFPQENPLDYLLTAISLFSLDGTSVDPYGLVDGTPAAIMPGQISNTIKEIRSYILQVVNLLAMFLNLSRNLLFPKK